MTVDKDTDIRTSATGRLRAAKARGASTFHLHAKDLSCPAYPERPLL